jgi:hypothetical protein
MLIKQIADDIRKAYLADPLKAETAIEKLLEERIAGQPFKSMPEFSDELCKEFAPSGHGAIENSQGGYSNSEPESIAKALSMILGKEISHTELTSEDLMQRLAESFGTIFDSLNELIRVMNTTLLGETSQEETIRTFIGSHMEGQESLQSIKAYIEQIQKTFLITQKAFKGTARSIVRNILTELDPEQISKVSGGGLKVGPLRKAECFEVFEKKYNRCNKWFESDRFMEDFLREFEKNCQRLYAL